MFVLISFDGISQKVEGISIMDAVVLKKGMELNKKYIIIPGRNIKRLGSYQATLRLHKDVVVKYPYNQEARDLLSHLEQY